MQRRSARSLNPSADPAVLTAHLLLRIGFGVLAVGVPVTAAFSRRSIFILLPFGAGLIFLAAAMLDLRAGGRRLLNRLRSPIGLAAVLLAIWAGLSIVWTPFHFEAGLRLFKLVGTTVLAVVAVAFLPERMRLSSLYLLPIGLALAAAMTLAFSFTGMVRMVGGTEAENFTIERGTIMLVVLIWPALAALATRGRIVSAVALAFGVAVAAIAARTPNALVALGLGGLTYAAALHRQRRTATILAIVAAGLLLLAPLLPLVIVTIAKLASGSVPEALQPAAAWADIVIGHKQRLLTGHGLETMTRGLAVGYLPAATPRSTLFEIWYELGSVGAFVLAFITMAAFRAADRRAEGAAPFLIAALATTIVLGVLGQNATQLWWVTLLAVAAISFGGVVNGQYRTRRPSLRPAIESRPQHSAS